MTKKEFELLTYKIAINAKEKLNYKMSNLQGVMIIKLSREL